MRPGKAGKDAMIKQGYVPETCTLHEMIAGPLIFSEVSKGKDPCSECYALREDCKGRPRKEKGLIITP